MSTVEGNIVIPSQAHTVNAARAAVRIRDITYSDAPELISERLMVIDVAPGTPVPFSIDVPDNRFSGTPTLNLEVHIDLDGSGNFSPGDLVSMQPHRILPDTRRIDVPVSLV
ncbi:MAG: hypothetical protein ACRDTC_01755 [Pseudonocardiaceae bacterium]